MSRPGFTGLDPILEFAQIEPCHVGPDYTHRMIFPDQALDIDCSQLNLIALGLPQARGSMRRRLGLQRCNRQRVEQFIPGHHPLLRLTNRRESQSSGDPLHPQKKPLNIHSL
jgi:hypothetical protein